MEPIDSTDDQSVPANPQALRAPSLALRQGDKQKPRGNGKAYLVIGKFKDSSQRVTVKSYGVFTTVEDANNCLRAKANASNEDIKQWIAAEEPDGRLSLWGKDDQGVTITFRIECYTIKTPGSVAAVELDK